MNAKKLVTLLTIYFLSSTPIIQAMEKSIFFSNTTNGSMQIQSIINKQQKYTELIIDNVNGGITNFRGTLKTDRLTSKNIGMNLKGVNNLGKMLAFIQIQSSGQVSLMEPHLEIEITDEDDENGVTFAVNLNAHTTKPIINLNGNETWDGINIHCNKTLLNTTGFQQCIIRLNHGS